MAAPLDPLAYTCGSDGSASSRFIVSMIFLCWKLCIVSLRNPKACPALPLAVRSATRDDGRFATRAASAQRRSLAQSEAAPLLSGFFQKLLEFRCVAHRADRYSDSRPWLQATSQNSGKSRDLLVPLWAQTKRIHRVLLEAAQWHRQRSVPRRTSTIDSSSSRPYRLRRR